MFMQPRAEDAPELAESGPFTRAVLVATAAVILFLGIYPTPVANWAAQSGMPLFKQQKLITQVDPTADTQGVR
jgi:NADH:ubiquinone oxidoreductase subunit 2 (subunit N)